MLTTLFICLCLGTNAHTALLQRLVSATSTSTLPSTIDSSSLSSSDSITSSSSLIDVNEELAKLATTCLTPQDFELLTGNALRYHLVGMFIHALLEQSVTTIGLEELRTALKLSALPPWKPFIETEPSEHELASATTIEEYYNLREPRSERRSLDSRYFFEHTIDTAKTYLNKRLPSIQTIFKKTFEEVCPSAPGVLDKKAIDSMIELFRATVVKIEEATSKMLLRFDCWGDVI